MPDRQIPPPLTEVEIPQNFGPSALGQFRACRLQLVLAGREHGDFLAAGPEAAVGRLVHRVAEMWGRGHGSDPQSLFAQLADESRGELHANPDTAHYADLSGTMSHAAWLEVRASAVAKCLPRVERQLVQVSPGRQTDSMGFEKSMVSDRLRLSAKIDRVSRCGGNVYMIRDHKTGRVQNDDGSIREEIAFQLRLYGLLVLERFPGCDVVLIVDSGEEFPVSFTDRDRLETSERLNSIIGPMLPKTKVSAVDLAVPGESCIHCKARTVCLAYRRVAPDWWKSHPHHFARIPQDVWGTVTETKTVEGRLSLRILDRAGRIVKVTNLGERHGIGNAVGAELWFFNLVATGTGRGWNGQAFHPHAFHEMPRDRGERRAWGLKVFQDGGSPEASPAH